METYSLCLKTDGIYVGNWIRKFSTLLNSEPRNDLIALDVGSRSLTVVKLPEVYKLDENEDGF